MYSSTNNEQETETVNYNGVDYEVYKFAHIVAMPPVHISSSVILRTFSEYLVYVNSLETTKDWTVESTDMTPVNDIVKGAGSSLKANFTKNGKQKSRGKTTGNGSSSRKTAVSPTRDKPPQDTAALKIFNSAKSVLTQRNGSGEPKMTPTQARSELKALNGTDEGKKLTKMTGMSWETNGSYNLRSATGISPQAPDFKKLKPHTVAVYWLATKSYPPDVKKKVEKLHVNATKASTKKGSDSSSDDKKTSGSDTASISTTTQPQSTKTPKVDSGEPPLDENDHFRIVRVDGASDALLVDGKMYTQKQLTSVLSGPLPRRDHHKRRRSRREENEDPAGSGSSADSNGTDSSHSSGRSSRTGRGRRSRTRRRDDRSGH